MSGRCSSICSTRSAVFRPVDFDFWVADGLAPVCNNTYVGFNLMEELADNGSTKDPGTLSPNDYVKTDDYRALRKYYEAAVNFMVPPTDEDAAFRKLEEAIEIKPDEVIYRRLASLMLLRKGEASRALEHLRLALDCVQSTSELAQAHLLLGFANDLLGNRDSALGCYEEVLGIASSAEDGILACVSRFVAVDAEKYSRVQFTLENAKKLEVNIEITGRYDL